jgi:hypothetical protein
VSETHEHNTSGGNVSRHDDDQPKRGRPSDYSFQVAISICARLAEGKSLRAICQSSRVELLAGQLSADYAAGTN